MTNDMISPHEVRVLSAFRRDPGRWLTNREVAEAAGVVPRTVRAHTANLTKLGVLEEARVFGGHKYRPAAAPGPEAAEYLARWEQARELFGESA